MTMHRFNRLSRKYKLMVIYFVGVPLLKRKDADRTLQIYQVHDFYVECAYLSSRFIFKIVRSFRDTSALDPYLEQIDISSVCGEQ
jgi:hypothetical protein